MDPLPKSQSRIQSVDALRGLVMIIMALDHTRDFVHRGAQLFSPLDLEQTSAIIFLTRWVTHICAPVFMFTAGIGAFLWMNRGRSKPELAWFLVTRGAWLLLLEVTVVHFAMTFNFDYSLLILEVIWALGCCMILLAGLAYLPTRWLAIFSIGLILLHNLTDGVSAETFGRFSWAWILLHRGGPLTLGTHTVVAGYPLIPWIGVMSAGFCFGHIILMEPEVRRKWMLRLGAGMCLAFFVIRAINIYGDPNPWSRQTSPLFTALSFLNTTKYPPSLEFLLMTLGPAFLLFAWMDRRSFAKENPLLVFGRVPLFYFVIHLFVGHAIAVALAFVRYGKAPFLFLTFPALGGPRELFPQNFGYSLWVVYFAWCGVVIALYPICRWFSRVKERRKDWWLSYL